MGAAFVVGERLSKHLSRTPENFLLASAVVVGRSGWQRYRACELGLTDVPPNELVQVWRDPSQVFSKKTLASGECKPVTILHPAQFVSPDTSDVIRGIMVNLRRGEMLADGSGEGMLADFVLWDPLCISQVEAGILRACSLGYRCLYFFREDGSFEQRDIVINHCALLDGEARGGTEVEIKDGKGINMKNADWARMRQQLDSVCSLLEEFIAQRESGTRRRTLTDEVNSIARSGRRTEELSGSRIGPASFHQALRRVNRTYDEYCSTEEQGQKFADEVNSVGARMRGEGYAETLKKYRSGR